ncbi:MAG: hypothetical protein II882_09595, partial [Lachnospiraceae bacterium]|nr:hypothetical protein [Lachnospiraceae bacterium]
PLIFPRAPCTQVRRGLASDRCENRPSARCFLRNFQGWNASFNCQSAGAVFSGATINLPHPPTFVNRFFHFFHLFFKAEKRSPPEPENSRGGDRFFVSPEAKTILFSIII